MSFLNIDVQNEVQIPLKAVIGESIAVLGIKGSGKTNTAAVLIEELLANGLPLTIVDIEGEYWGLKEKFEVFVVGRSPNVDISVGVSHAASFAEFSLKHGVSLVLDLSDLDPIEAQDFLLEYFNALWLAAFKARRPYQIVLEEAHEFVPQSARTPLKDVFTRIALRGRKRGLGIITVSQRSAKVEKDILTQAAIVFLHRVVHPIDIKIYQEILPIPPREVELRVSELRSGRAMVLYDNAVQYAQIRVRHTFHAGVTPELQPAKRPKFRQINDSLLAELRKMAQQPTGSSRLTVGELDKVKRLEQMLVEKEKQIADQQKTIERLKTQVDLLSKLEVKVDNPVTNNVPAAPVGELSVKRINAEKFVVPSVEPSVSESASQPQASSDSGSNVKQQRRFEHLLADVRRLPRFQRVMLAFLSEREGVALTARELARWLDVKSSTIENRPPLDMIKMGLMLRKGVRGNYQYESTARQQIASMFPDLNTDQLLERFVRSLK